MKLVCGLVGKAYPIGSGEINCAPRLSACFSEYSGVIEGERHETKYVSGHRRHG